MRTLLIKSIIIILIFIGKEDTNGQSTVPKYEAGINLGTFIYQGDLTPQRLGSLKTQTLTLSVFGNRIINSSFSLRTNLVLGKLKGDDSKYTSPAYRQQRNFYFKTPVVELSELLVWNAFGKNYEQGKGGFSPYLMAGAGLSYLKIKRDWSRLNENYFAGDSAFFAGLNADIAHDLPRLIAVIPIGAGMRYSITQNLAVSAEAIYRLTFTDYLDGFSQSVNPKLDDHYYSVTVGLIYRLGMKNRLNCPTVPK